jgi:hypothetical protein
MCGLLWVAVPAAAQNEAALRETFVGQSVVLKIDLPASHKGLDLRFDKTDPVDQKEQFGRLKDYDVSLKAGDRATVSHIKVKDDMIEFHLDGGGFNWGTDSTTQTFTSSSKTARESELERMIKDETDRQRKRDLERELNDVRRRREERDERRRREIEDYNADARERDRERALRAGSRINLRFKKKVPPEVLTADGLLRQLDPWLTLASKAPAGKPAAAPAAAARAGGPPPVQQSSANPVGSLRKGLTRKEVEQEFGRPTGQRSCSAGAFDCVELSYAIRTDQIDATFVEDVLVKFSVKKR